MITNNTVIKNTEALAASCLEFLELNPGVKIKLVRGAPRVHERIRYKTPLCELSDLIPFTPVKYGAFSR